MLVDDVFLENEITVRNFASLNYTQALQSEKRLCELHELADGVANSALELYNDGYGMYEILSIVNEGLSFPDTISEYKPISENLKSVSSYVKTVSSEDKAVFASLLAERMRDCGISVFENDFLKEEKREETFIYVKNLLADEAFDVFSQEFSDPRISYSHTFRETVDAVLSGTCEYCILPLEERGGSRITGIEEMLFAEDLKISAVTPVFGMDGSADMKYALVSRHFNIPEFDPDDDRYLEIRFLSDSTGILKDILIAADIHNVDVYRVNTVVFNTDDGPQPYFDIVFRKSKADFSGFLVYLTLFCPSYTAIGIYKNLE